MTNIEEGDGIDAIDNAESNDLNEGDNINQDGGDDDVPNLPSDHPLIRRLQDGLKQQLSEQRDKIEVEIREKVALKNKLSAEREEIGVQLYTIQQQLAKLQTKLQESNEQRAEYEQERLQLEGVLKEERTQLEALQLGLKQREQEYESQRDELDKLNEVVLRLERHNQEVASQVAVTRRETYKSEQAACETEVSKREQDLYIDRLTNQMKDISGDLAILEAQIIAQRNESKTARDALLQSSLEMEKINFERNQLVQDWNSSLIGIKLRTKTLQDLEKASNKQEETIRSLQNEYSGLKAQINDQQEINEKNRGLQNKINSRMQFLQHKIANAKEEREQLQKKLTQLNELVSDKEAVINRLIVEKNSARIEFKQSQKGANELSIKIHEIEDKIISHVTEQTNLKRDAVAAQNMVQKVREQIEEKDRELSDVQNEVMRLRIDKLNISDQCQKFENGLNAIIEELQEKDNLISQYESQIRRNNVDIEKKQSEVDKLNRKYRDLVSDQNGEEYGPLEREIRQLQLKIQQSDKASAECQTNWLKMQTELVLIEKSCEELQTENTSKQAHIAVLSRKRDRTRNQLAATEKEVGKLQVQVRILQREMSKLGEQLSASIGSGNVLVEGNINFEAEILENLRQKEEEAASTERQIEEIANKREELAEDLMETEKAIMMWEKKIQLAKEMREALDPNYGTGELRAMRKEVNRMETRLKQIKRQQENIVKNMEFALKRRTTIADRVTVQKRLNKDKTRADIARGITDLKRQAKKLNNETAKFDRFIQQDNDALKERNAEIEQLQHILRESQRKRDEITNAIFTEERAKAVAQARLERLQQKNRLFQAGGTKTILKSTDAFESAYANVKNQEEQICALLDSLVQDFPHLSNEFQLVRDKLTAN